MDTFVPGGKAVNVARWLSLRGAEVACGGLLGEDNATLFERELAKYAISDHFVRVPGATRVNEMFVSPAGSFKVNRPTTAPILDLGVFGDFSGYDTVVFSGSLPQDWPVDTYRRLLDRAKHAGARTVLDTSGPALVEGVKARPDVIKPNAEECADLVGFVPKTPDDFHRATDILRRLCAFPIISDGDAGCWFDGLFVAAPRVDVLDTTAAGDTLLAEWCFSGSPEQAVAAGSAACTMPGGEPPAVTLSSFPLWASL